MQSERPFARRPLWQGGSTSDTSTSNHTFASASGDMMGSAGGDETPPVMSATAGPLDTEDFYWAGMHGTPSPQEEFIRPPPPLPRQPASQQGLRSPSQTLRSPSYALRSASQSPARMYSASPPSSSSPALSSVRSTPALLHSRAAGSVKNIANRFNQSGTDTSPVPQAAVRQRKPVASKSRSPSRRSPTREGAAKMPKKRSGALRSPRMSPHASFETSFSSTNSAQHQQPQQRMSHAKPPASYRPLFGEITADGQWSGNFDLGFYEPIQPIKNSARRSSDSATALRRGRSQSQHDMSWANPLAPEPQHLTHQRSRSDMNPWGLPTFTHVPTFTSQDLPISFPTPPQPDPPHTRPKTPTASRIPVSSARMSDISGGSPRSASPASQYGTGRSRTPKTPSRTSLGGKENPTPNSSSRSRYNAPPPLPLKDSQSLSARIVPLPSKASPPLRSSRPRQPVSSATTAASRARTADRFEPQRKDGQRPSEQWLGKPYDAQQERSKRKIPQLGKVDFEERRARIQQAISQNLEESRSLEDLRNRSQSRQSSRSHDQTHGSDSAGRSPEMEQRQGFMLQHSHQHQHPHPHQDQHLQHLSVRQVEVPAKQTPMPGDWPLSPDLSRPRALSIDTNRVSGHATLAAEEPMTATTEFEEETDESPVLGRNVEHRASMSSADPHRSSASFTPPVLLSSATYQAPSAKKLAPVPFSPVQEESSALTDDGPRHSTLLENAMQMRQSHSPSADSRTDTDFAPDTPSAEGSSTGFSDRWGLGRSIGDEGSIQIMLENEPTWVEGSGMQSREAFQFPWEQGRDRENMSSDLPISGANGFAESPDVESDGRPEQDTVVTPRKNTAIYDGQLDGFPPPPPIPMDPENEDPQSTVARLLHQYRSTGDLSPEMMDRVQQQMVDLQRASANGISNGIMIQSLLDSVLQVRDKADETNGVDDVQSPDTEVPDQSTYLPPVTPDTPPGWRPGEESGTAKIFHTEPDYEESPVAISAGDEPDEDFAEKIRKADEAWERQQRGSIDVASRPLPPPKDLGLPTRSSVSLGSFPTEDLSQGLRISAVGPQESSTLEIPGFLSTAPSVTDARLRPSMSTPALVEPHPPLPMHAPPVPPLANTSPTLPLLGVGDKRPTSSAFLESGSPRLQRTAYAQSSSSRPSVDSLRAPTLIAGSVSASSLGDSTRQTSLDTMGTDNQIKLPKPASPSPDQKRLLKRRHIIRELLDTENTYHQDLKIIEDIYRATATPDLVSSDDKKVLFGNCDEIERFSLHFFDDLRKAAASVYVPPKTARWGNKRSSYSTTQSDSTPSNTPEVVDEEKDRATTIGQAFLQNLPAMEQIYSAYLRNHDAANRRLTALRNTSTVKCWLAECHNNASDITTAWDLDSLLVKPTQRVAKYPMLLHQLLESTPPNHPDRESLSSAAKDSVAMLTRINDAKKRADLVDQIVNGKARDTDVRSGIAKAFGRRTEKLKERVGMAEAFQDPDFDELAHKFGGHFIRLQICMRDVQDYMHRIEKSVDQINQYANVLDLFTDLCTSSLTEIQSKWRKYGQVIRELTAVAFAEHRSAVNKRVIGPMVACIKLHDGPQNAISKRKKRIVDYAKCKSLEKRGEKPDKRTIEAAEMYEALNEQLKLDLPKLYSLTGSLVQHCLNCFLDVQLKWYYTWERKLKPVLDAADLPNSIADIEPAFRPDFDLVKNRTLDLGICNGSILAEAANYSSSTLVGESEPSSAKASFSQESSRRTHSMGSESSPQPGSYAYTRRSSGYAYGADALPTSSDGRMGSTSSLSQRGTTPVPAPGSGLAPNRPWSNSQTPTHSFTTPTRPDTGNAASHHLSYSGYRSPRRSVDQTQNHSRPASGSTYFTTQPSASYADIHQTRFSGIFSSAMPPSDPSSSSPALPLSTSAAGASIGTSSPRPSAPPASAPDDMRVLFVCASLFEFSIDKTRREGGYPYLTYVQGEVFDVVAQKGELWLAKNQDDGSNMLGWIWEQHFVILSQD